MNSCAIFPSKGTGNVLKIQNLLHTCSEYHGNKEEEGVTEDGAEGDAATIKEGNSTSTIGVANSESGDTTKTKSSDSSDKKSATGRDVEMKDTEAAEVGSLSEPGAHQAISVLGIALIAMGEDIGSEMALRTFNHLVRSDQQLLEKYIFHVTFFLSPHQWFISNMILSVIMA